MYGNCYFKSTFKLKLAKIVALHGNHYLKSTCKPKLAISITLNKKSKEIITSNLLLNQIKKKIFLFKTGNMRKMLL